MRKYLLLGAAVFGAASCAGDSPTAPVAAAGGATLGYTAPPGWRLTDMMLSGRLELINCTPRVSATGSAIIGPSGGVLWIGKHRLIVPAGAVLSKVLISGTVPEGKPFEVDLQPHGLQFRKAAGLILDASSCTNVPNIVYLVDEYTTSAPITAMYSAWWRMIACPIWHFSGYAVALGMTAEDGE